MGENVVRTIAMDGKYTTALSSLWTLLITNLLLLGTEGLVRGAAAHDTGHPIQIPVGPKSLGRIVNVTGDPIDERGPVEGVKKASIHAEPPAYVDQSTEAEVLVTGIKVVDLIAPYARGGKIGLFGGAGVGKTVFIQELIVSCSLCDEKDFPSCANNVFTNRTTSPRPTVVTLSSQVSESVLVRVTICTMKCRKLVSLTSKVTPRWPSCSVR